MSDSRSDYQYNPNFNISFHTAPLLSGFNTILFQFPLLFRFHTNITSWIIHSLALIPHRLWVSCSRSRVSLWWPSSPLTTIVPPALHHTMSLIHTTSTTLIYWHLTLGIIVLRKVLPLDMWWVQVTWPSHDQHTCSRLLHSCMWWVTATWPSHDQHSPYRKHCHAQSLGPPKFLKELFCPLLSIFLNETLMTIKCLHEFMLSRSLCDCEL